jgi:hypothetical protein
MASERRRVRVNRGVEMGQVSQLNISREWEMERGERVLALSGRLLGYVGDVNDAIFQLLCDDGEYWLTQECIYLQEIGTVVLICEWEGVERYVIACPIESQGAESA